MNRWMVSAGVAVLLVLVVLGVFYALPEPTTEQLTLSESVDYVPVHLAPLPYHDIRVSRTGFYPSEIVVPHGEEVVLNLRSTDGLEHGFAIQGLSVFRTIPHNESIEVRFLPESRGTYEFYSFIRHRGVDMDALRGVIVVE